MDLDFAQTTAFAKHHCIECRTGYPVQATNRLVRIQLPELTEFLETFAVIQDPSMHIANQMVLSDRKPLVELLGGDDVPDSLM
jgi:hypothetical protein